MPLRPERHFLPDLSLIPREIADQAKLLWINYPNNPTGSLASLDFFAELVEYCRQHDILLCHDHAYSEIAYDGYKPPSVLQVPGAKDIAIEFHSLSKTYNMTGWRIGFVVGNAAAIGAIARVKSNIDSGVFKAIQRAAIASFETPETDLQLILSIYQKRRDIIVQGLRSLGWPLEPPKASLYVWVPVPSGFSSAEFSSKLLETCGIVVPPGSGYGAGGEGFFRIALTVKEEQLEAAIQRMKSAGLQYA